MYDRKKDIDYQLDTYQGGSQELHPRITKNNLIRRLKWLKSKQNDTAQLHPTKIKIINDTINMIQEQNNDRDAYEIFLNGFTWHPNATSPVEVTFEKEYREVCGDELVDEYCPIIYSKDRNEDEFNVKEIIFGRPLNRLDPHEGKTIITPIPRVTESDARQTLKYICDHRAIQLGNLGKDIYMLWSGGIDSTLALHSLNQNNVKFYVIMDSDTVEEYPELADQVQSWDNCLGVVFDPKPSLYGTILSDPDNVMISGGNGDELFGGEPNCAGEIENADQQYDFYIPKYVTETTDQYIQELLEPLYGQDVMKDMTVCEWRWAMNFIYRYQQIQISSAYMLGMDILNNRGGASAYHFYDTRQFNIWSIQNYQSLCGDGEDKQVAKDLIYSYDGNEWFHKEKKKVCSMKKTRYRSGKNYVGTGGAVGTDIGKNTVGSYGSTVVLDKRAAFKLFKPGVLIGALEREGNT